METRMSSTQLRLLVRIAEMVNALQATGESMTFLRELRECLQVLQADKSTPADELLASLLARWEGHHETIS